MLSTVPLTDLPQLSSNPSAAYTLHLDFDSHVIELGNSYALRPPEGGPSLPIHLQPYTEDNDPWTYSVEELASIELIWSIIAEDFSMFDINVTTVEPPIEDFAAGALAQRILFTDRGDNVEMGGTGLPWGTPNNAGVAHLNSWSTPRDEPAFVWVKGAVAGYTGTHESGHTLGLRHDSWINPSNGDVDNYYDGHFVANGGYSWRTPMGQSFAANAVSQWSNGDYSNNAHSPPLLPNDQDDIAIIAGQVGFRPDDHSDTISLTSATPLTPLSGEFISTGIIEQRTDVDVFSISVGAGELLTIEAIPHLNGPSVNLKMDVYDSSGVFLATSSPGDSLAADLSLDLVAGNYLITIDGVGEGVAPDNGYTDYGSLGMYELRGTIGSESPIVVSNSTLLYGKPLYGLELLDRVKSVEFKFSGGVGETFGLNDVVIFNSAGTVDLTAANLSSSGTLTSSLEEHEIDLEGLALPSGEYTLSIDSSGVYSSFGMPIDGDKNGMPGGDFSLDFTIYETGDVNLDGVVDVQDLRLIIQNKGTTIGNGDIGWTEGNLDGNLGVDSNDLVAWYSYLVSLEGGYDLGDVNRDGTIDLIDIESLYETVAVIEESTGIDRLWYDFALSPAIYDLNDDDLVDQSDIDFLYDLIGSTSGSSVLAIKISGSASIHDDYLFENGVNVGSGEQLRTVPVGNADTVSITFSTDVSVQKSHLQLIGLQSEGTIDVSSSSFSYDSNTRTAIWVFPNGFAADQYLIWLSDTVTNSFGLALDGEWTNPAALSTVNSGLSTFPSGDGTAGGSFEFVFTILPGDSDRDNDVDASDLFAVQVNFGMSPASFTDSDFNGSGGVDASDLIVVQTHFGTSLVDLAMAGDFDDDYAVGNDELTILLASWEEESEFDIDGDGNMGDAELTALLSQWGVNLDVLS